METQSCACPRHEVKDKTSNNVPGKTLRKMNTGLCIHKPLSIVFIFIFKITALQGQDLAL